MKPRQITITLIAVSVLLFSLIATFFFRSELRRVKLPATGKRIDIGGYKLQIQCKGEGQPAVIMEAGLTHGISTWDRIVPEIAKSTSVCAYDRAGIGGSDPGPEPRTSLQMVHELNALLQKGQVASPYVLVGHSFGCLNVRLYTSRYPEKVVGMVLVDPSHEDQSFRYAELMETENRKVFLAYENGKNPEHVDVIASASQVRTSTPIPDIPLVVITAAFEDWLPKTNQIERVRQELQRDLVNLVPHGIQVKAEGSGHFVQMDRPELVIQAIQFVIEQTRKNKGSRN